MKLLQITILAYCVLLAACSQEADHVAEATNTADYVFTNGKVYTVNENQPWAEAVAIKNGQFLVVGSASDMDAVTGQTTEVIDLGGDFVMPGVVDAHIHLSLIHISEPTRPRLVSRMPSSA